jgi:hypothetical protein
MRRGVLSLDSEDGAKLSGAYKVHVAADLVQAVSKTKR